MTITLFYAGLLGIGYLLLTARVIRGRQTKSINLGSGNDADMERRIRGHANFVEYVPMILLLMLLLELSQVNALLLHGVGLALLAGRILHGVALSFTEKWMLGRFYGTVLTLSALLISSIAAVVLALTRSL
ncbi:MAG: MAPEG family protein [Oceanococcaceae bacterium]